MKKYMFLMLACLLLTACGSRQGSKASEGKEKAATEATHDHNRDGHSHAPGEAAHQHDHADGEECDHAHESDGHSHGEEASHNHADGEECTHDHSGHSHGEAEAAHDHEHGPQCNHDHSEGDGHDHSGHDHGTHDHSGHDHGDGGHVDGEIVFSNAQAARTDFEVQTIGRSTFTEVIRVSGRILAAQGDEVTLVSPVAGIVSFAGTSLSEGNRIGASQTVFHISSRNIASGDQAVKNEAAYRRAKAAYDRALSLREDKIVSQRELEEAESTYIQAKAEYESIAGSQSERGTAVKSSISGYVTSLAVNEGDYVEMGETLATVSQNRRLQLRAEASQRYYPALRSVRSANFTVPYDDTTYELSALNGRLISVGRSAAGGSSLIPVTFEFDNNGSVIPGAYVEVYLLGAPVADAIAVPLTAISEQQGLYYVYIRIGAEVYERREVKTGARDGLRVMVLSGIEPGDKVVTRGAVNLKMASASDAIPHGHEH